MDRGGGQKTILPNNKNFHMGFTCGISEASSRQVIRLENQMRVLYYCAQKAQVEGENKTEGAP